LLWVGSPVTNDRGCPVEIDLLAYLLGAWVFGFTAGYKILAFKKFTEVATS
tara:strand:+ start:65 stop:217 length:153 start_codon:yes stop_codon:yes gene_type:complete